MKELRESIKQMIDGSDCTFKEAIGILREKRKERTMNATENGNAMEKHSSYHIQTDGFQQVLVGMFHMIQTVPLDRKCRVVIDYDPALPKVGIETFTDKSNGAQAQGKPFQWIPYGSTPQ